MKKQTIQLSKSRNQTANVEAYISDSGQLALHRPLYGETLQTKGWTITHVESGCAIWTFKGSTLILFKEACARVAALDTSPLWKQLGESGHGLKRSKMRELGTFVRSVVRRAACSHQVR